MKHDLSETNQGSSQGKPETNLSNKIGVKMQVSMYHNPRCSKSRETLALLEKQGITPKLILYMETPPNEEAILTVCKKLRLPAKALVRFKEETAKKLGLSASDTRDDAEWIRILANHPILIERPIVITEEKAAIGRPPENVLGLFPSLNTE